MLAEQRHRLILDRLGEDGAVSIATLSAELSISRETVRRDVQLLAGRGLLRKTHGGALPLVAVEPDVGLRFSLNPEGKRAIGRRAALEVPDGASIILDSGTTTRAIADALTARHGLVVYTNDLEICRRLARRNGNRVILLGGEIQAHEEATIGWDAIETLSRYYADFAFVGAGGITAEGELTDFGRDAAELRSRMLGAARWAAVVADHSKFGRVTPARVAGFGRGRKLITDKTPPRALRAALEALGIEILLPERAKR
jgi:DeoR family glycerol-3-phosphate regulon repressor